MNLALTILELLDKKQECCEMRAREQSERRSFANKYKSLPDESSLVLSLGVVCSYGFLCAECVSMISGFGDTIFLFNWYVNSEGRRTF